jgi:hypothetical protein
MWTFIKGYFAPLTNPLLALAIGTLAGIYAGYKVTSNYYDAKQSRVDQAVIEQLVEQTKIDRKTITDLTTNVNTLQNAYSKLGGKVRETKIVTSPCLITDAGRMLWNESLLGKEILSDSTYGTNATRGTSGTTTIEEAYDNKLENDKRAAINREKIKKLKEWCVATFGKERCEGKYE